MPRLLLCSLAALVLADCASPKPAALALDRSIIYFDTVDSAAGSHAKLGVTNVGQHTTPQLAVELHGDVDQIAIDDDACNGRRLLAGETCIVDLALKSDVAGDFHGGVVISGAGLAAVEAELHGKVSAPRLALSTDSGTVDAVPGETGTASVLLHNMGGATSGPVTLAIDGDAKLSGNCSGRALAGGESCAVTVTWVAPATVAGPMTMTVSALGSPGGTATQALMFNPLSVKLDGVHMIMLSTSGPIPQIGSTDVRVTPITGASVSWAHTSIAMNDPHDEGACTIDKDPCTGVALVPGASCALSVKCTARGVGAHQGTLALIDAGGRTVGKGTLDVYGAAAYLVVDYAGKGTGMVSGAPADDVIVDPFAVWFGFGQSSGSITLNAVPSPGSMFAGWTGGCAGVTVPTCTVQYQGQGWSNTVGVSFALAP